MTLKVICKLITLEVNLIMIEIMAPCENAEIYLCSLLDRFYHWFILFNNLGQIFNLSFNVAL